MYGFRGSYHLRNTDASEQSPPSGDACAASIDADAGSFSRDSAGLHAVFCGHPQWRDSALKELAQSQGNSAALMAAWRQRGDGILDVLAGDFALLIIDEAAGRVFAATDRIGRWPLFYAHTQEQVACSTNAGYLKDIAWIDSHLSEQAIYSYLYFHMVPSPLSIFRGISKLPGAHVFDWQRGKVTVRCWWQPQFTEDSHADMKTLGAEMMGIIRKSVGRLADNAAVGAFLSGGLDSSTVAGVLSEIRPNADTFSIGFDVAGYDEISYARIAVQHFNTQRHEYYVTPEDVVASIPQIAEHYDEPFGNSSALPAYYCAKMARECGIERLLAGDGGDEIFAGNERYAKQKVFELYANLPGVLKTGIRSTLAALPQTPALLRKARSYVEQASVPLPDRLESYNFLHRIDAATMFTPDFLQQVDQHAPEELMRDIYRRPADASSLNRMMYLDWQRTLADNDLRKVQRTCELAGVDVVYPLLDDELVEFSCRVPSRMKLPGHRLRYFYKQATQDFLPAEILRKKKHGFGLPFGIWMKEHPALRAMACESLGQLAQRGWIRAEFIDEVLKLHNTAHSSYYGELVWILVMLEQWLEAHHV